MAVGFCTECFTEHWLNDHNVPHNGGQCMKCGKKDSVKYSNDVPYTAYCSECYSMYKTFEKVVTFKKCPKCGQFNGLHFSRDPPVSATCKKCALTFYTNHFNITFNKCPNCKQFDGLHFKK